MNITIAEIIFRTAASLDDALSVGKRLLRVGGGREIGVAQGKVSPGTKSICVYAGTMGEFQIARPIIDAIRRDRELTLLLFVGQAQYVEPARKAYPDAFVASLPETGYSQIVRLFRDYPPIACFHAEGPSVFKRFPISFGLSLPVACARQNVRVYVINASVYDLSIEGKLAGLQERFLKGLFARPIETWFAASATHRDDLVAASVPREKIEVVGDLKFDVLFNAKMPDRSDAFSDVLACIEKNWSHCIVGGSVNAIDEQSALIDGWLTLRKVHPGAGLVIAPRYINNEEVMTALFSYLEKRKVRYLRRSRWASGTEPFDVLIVDTFGELMHFYSVCDVAYIGRNHGVLEPLRFRKPVIVAPDADWRHDYSAYPLYKQMCDLDALVQLNDKSELGKVLTHLIDDDQAREQLIERAVEVVAENRGATARTMELLSLG